MIRLCFLIARLCSQRVYQADLTKGDLVEFLCSKYLELYYYRFENSSQNYSGYELGVIVSRHVLFASSTHNSYAGATFPGLVDLMYGIEKLEGAAKTEQWTKVEKHLAAVTFLIDSAAATLNDPSQFF